MISSTNPDELLVKEPEDEPIIKLKVIRNSFKVIDSGHMLSLVTPHALRDNERDNAQKAQYMMYWKNKW